MENLRTAGGGTPDEMRHLLVRLKNDGYNFLVLYYVVRRTIDLLELEGLSDEQIDRVVFNRMIDRLESREESKNERY